jgi:hypothetical protein
MNPTMSAKLTVRMIILTMTQQRSIRRLRTIRRRLARSHFEVSLDVDGRSGISYVDVKRVAYAPFSNIREEVMRCFIECKD